MYRPHADEPSYVNAMLIELVCNCLRPNAKLILPAQGIFGIGIHRRQRCKKGHFTNYKDADMYRLTWQCIVLLKIAEP